MRWVVKTCNRSLNCNSAILLLQLAMKNHLKFNLSSPYLRNQSTLNLHPFGQIPERIHSGTNQRWCRYFFPTGHTEDTYWQGPRELIKVPSTVWSYALWHLSPSQHNKEFSPKTSSQRTTPNVLAACMGSLRGVLGAPKPLTNDRTTGDQARRCCFCWSNGILYPWFPRTEHWTINTETLQDSYYFCWSSL